MVMNAVKETRGTEKPKRSLANGQSAQLLVLDFKEREKKMITPLILVPSPPILVILGRKARKIHWQQEPTFMFNLGP